MSKNGQGSDELIPVVDEEHDLLPEPPTPATHETEHDPYRSVLRLLVGSALVTASELSRRLREFEEAHQAAGRAAGAIAPDDRPALHAAIGLLFAAYEAGRDVTDRAKKARGLMTRIGHAAVRPVARSRLLRPARRRARGLMARGATELAAWQELGHAEEAHSRLLARRLFNVGADDLVAFLSDNEEVDKLIDAKVDVILAEMAEDPRVTSLIHSQVDVLLPQLAEDPELQAFVLAVAGELLPRLSEDEQLSALIQKQGDSYLQYLQVENSEQVQVLIQGQSIGLAGEMLNEVRERTVTADNVIEAIVRGILRRRPRSELPSPPPEVRALAEPPKQQLDRRGHGTTGMTSEDMAANE